MAKQLEFNKVKGWGGKRRGAGRKNRSGLVNHAKRERIDFKKPLNITMHLKEGAPKLRRKEWFKEFAEAVKIAKKFELNTLHFSLLNNHIHMIVEAKNNSALARGMKSITGRMGKKLGGVFEGRYHLHVLKTPTEMKRALCYVLFNQSKHQKLLAYIDSFSTAKYFPELTRLSEGNPLLEGFKAWPLPDFLEAPRSWLASVGWQRGLGHFGI